MSSPESPPHFFRRLSAAWKLRRCAAVGRGAVVLGRVWIRGSGSVRLGKGVVLDGSYLPIELHALEPESEIVLGDGVRIDGGVSIEAVVSVRIGARTCIGAFAKVIDNHFHPLHGNRHWRPPSVPVVVGEDVEIGARAILLAGAQVDDGGAVGRATVITRRMRIPAGRSARGMPPVLE